MSVTIEHLEGNIALVNLGEAGEKAVSLSLERMNSLQAIFEDLKKKPPVAIIITGPHPDMFTVGADINLISNVQDKEHGRELAKKGQDIFSLLESIPSKKIAAISGPCVGGGCELVLACDYRIITDQKSSIIGLPEVKLGIIPGFGGTQRLPRLVGLKTSLDIILGGKTLRPKQALSVGLVDDVCSSASLIERAKKVATGALQLKRKKLSLTDSLLLSFSFLRSIVKKSVLQQITKETKGFYPAPLKALEAVFFGLDNPKKGYEHEAMLLGEAITTEESKSLVRVFFLTESAKNIGKAATKYVKEFSSSVIGAGVMGAGIASVFAKSEIPVILKDTSDEALAKAKQHIQAFADGLKYLTPQEKTFLTNRVTTTTQDIQELGGVGLVVEAIVENLHVKQKVLTSLSEKIPQDAIIASNTSSLSISKLAELIPHPERVVGMHFFNPVEKMPLVEIIMGEKTDNKVIALLAALTTKLGKYPIVVRDVPGFLVNRILTPYLNEAGRLLLDGFRVEDIDSAATSFGLPMGPIRLLDEIGLDVATHVSEIMVQGYGERMKPAPLVGVLSQRGDLGKKSKRGFYDFSGAKPTPRHDLNHLLGIKQDKFSADRKHIQERLLFSLFNEAVICLDDGVAGNPGPDAAHQIDLGCIMGFGFPPFRGGLLHWGDSLGASTILEKINKHVDSKSLEFEIAPGIKKRALRKEMFSR